MRIPPKTIPMLALLAGVSLIAACGGILGIHDIEPPLEASTGDASGTDVDVEVDSASGSGASADAESTPDAMAETEPPPVNEGGADAAPEGSTANPLACTGATGTGQCTSGTVCCGTLVLNGGTLGSCSVASLTASCQSRCTDYPPTTCGSAQNPVTDIVRLCTAKADCANNGTNINCCAYNNASTHWCAASQLLASNCLP